MRWQITFRFPPAVLLFFLVAICAVAGLIFLTIEESYRPLHHLEKRNTPHFSDDLDFDSLIESASRQAAFLEKQEMGKSVLFGDDSYIVRWLHLSLLEFLEKVRQRPNEEELNRFLQENFTVYQAGGRQSASGRQMLVTGYYEPLFAGSPVRRPPFIHPIYSPPENLISLPAKDGKKAIGRYDSNHRFVPYWSRKEIEDQKLLAGYELAYLKDPFDAFLLHVQGSGKIFFPDQSIHSVRFAGSNGLGYNSIGKLLVDEKIMDLEQVSVPAIRAYLRLNPKELNRILHHNPRFIFFDWGDKGAPRGSSGERLTGGRSIAIDNSALPEGSIGYLVSRVPKTDGSGEIVGWQKLHRFVFPQDSGAAIKGTGRVDLFLGSGDYAELAASHMKEEGKLYFLVKKGYLPEGHGHSATPGNSRTRGTSRDDGT